MWASMCVWLCLHVSEDGVSDCLWSNKKHELSLGTHSVMTAQLFPKLSSRQRGLWVSPGVCGRGLMGTAAANGPSCLAFSVIKSFSWIQTVQGWRTGWTINVECLNLSIREYDRCGAAGELFDWKRDSNMVLINKETLCVFVCLGVCARTCRHASVREIDSENDLFLVSLRN